MIIIKIFGGLGNQMFQYAFGKYLSDKYNKQLILDIEDFKFYKLRKFELHYFNIDFTTGDKKIYQKFRFFKSARLNYFWNKIILKRKNYHFDSKQFSQEFNLNDLDYFWGYWQKNNFDETIRIELLKLFTLKQPLSFSAEAFKIEIEKEEYQSVSIHIRKTDYLLPKNSYFANCDKFYFQNAIEIIKQKVRNPKFFIFSDDFNWVENNLNFENIQFMFVKPLIPHISVEDQLLMKLCKHNIIVNSTFSWWAAYLNENIEKIVISPKRWFSNSIKNLNHPNWIEIENE